MEEHLVDHVPGVFGGVRVIPVDHQITVGINLTEHRADDIPFSLTGFVADNRTGFPGENIGSVRGVVVIDIDNSFRKGFAVIADDF